MYRFKKQQFIKLFVLNEEKMKKILIACMCIVALMYIFSTSAQTTNETILINDTNITNSTNSTNVLSDILTDNLVLTSLFPKDAKVGDAQLNIQVQNVGDVEIKNIIAIVSGRGYSTYNVVPIDSLKTGEKSYVIVSGNFREEGIIPLEIKINNQIFYQNVSVVNPDAKTEEQNLEAESQKKNQIAELSSKLESLKQNYSALEKEVEDKKGTFDTSEVSLSDLKKFMRDAEADIMAGDLQNAKININFAMNEYNDQLSKFEHLKKVPLLTKLRENAVLFSTIAGALITFFALYELLKKKKEHIKQKISSKVQDKNANTNP